MTGRTADALVYVHAVIEVHKIRQVVDTGPLERFTGPVTSPHWFENFGVRPDLRMTAHADLGGWDSGERRSLHGCVTVAAINAVVAHMVLVAERDRLFLYNVNIGDVPAPVHRVGESDEHSRPKYEHSEAYF